MGWVSFRVAVFGLGVYETFGNTHTIIHLLAQEKLISKRLIFKSFSLSIVFMEG